MGVAWRTGAVRLRVGPIDPALRKARVCYDHLAGELGVLVHESLLTRGALITATDTGRGQASVELTAVGERLIQSLGIDVNALRARRRSFCHACLDWSERRHHLAGALGAALLGRIMELRWARRAKSSRARSCSRPSARRRCGGRSTAGSWWPRRHTCRRSGEWSAFTREVPVYFKGE